MALPCQTQTSTGTPTGTPTPTITDTPTQTPTQTTSQTPTQTYTPTGAGPGGGGPLQPLFIVDNVTDGTTGVNSNVIVGLGVRTGTGQSLIDWDYIP